MTSTLNKFSTCTVHWLTKTMDHEQSVWMNSIDVRVVKSIDVSVGNLMSHSMTDIDLLLAAFQCLISMILGLIPKGIHTLLQSH